MLTKSDLTAIESLLKPIKSDIGALKSDVGSLKSDVGSLKSDVGKIEMSLQRHTRNSKSEHARLQQSINRLADMYDADQTKTAVRLNRIERTLGFVPTA